MIDTFSLDHYTYQLSDDRIAQNPHHPPDEAKLLICGDMFSDTTYIKLPHLLHKNSVLFFNDTKVMQSRIPVLSKCIKLSTGIVTTLDRGEIFIYIVHDDVTFEALVADGKHYRPGSIISWTDTISLESLQFTQEGILFRISGMTVADFMQMYGQLPLPPYIEYARDKEQRYQTCFAQYIGSAAAPTASLHFTPRLLTGLSDASHILEYATLHVGLGTFKPVYHQDIRHHDIHTEAAMIDVGLFDRIRKYYQQGQSLVAIGTTMMRLLESLPFVWKTLSDKDTLFDTQTIAFWDRLSVDIENTIVSGVLVEDNHISFTTKIFIYPGFVFRVADELITNFHLPHSSLLMLIAACIGDRWQSAYAHALHHNYMFYSFGDGMWIPHLQNKISRI